MAEAFADDLDRHAGLEQQGRVGVAQVVEPHPGQAGSTHEFGERVGEQLGVRRFAIGPSEDMPVGVVAVELRILVFTVLPPGVQDGDGPRVEIDRSRAVRDLPRVSWIS